MTQERILLAEDESIVVLDIRRRLEGMGYRIAADASSGEEAIRLAEALRPDLVLMDVKLKGEIDGIGAAERIGADYGLPVIFLSAFADEQTLQRARVTKAFGYVLKPFEESELKANIEMALYKHRMELALRESEARYRAVVDTSPDSIALTDLDLKIVLCNQKSASLFGFENPAEMAGLNVLSLFAPEEQPRAIQNTSLTLEKGLSETMEYTLVRRDGSRFLGELSASLVLDNAGKPASFIGVLRDITGRKKVEEEVSRLYDAERQRSAALARSNAFIKALSQVAARVENTPNLDQVMEILGAELGRLKMSCAVGLYASSSQQIVIQYLSLKPKAQEVFEQLVGVGLLGRSFSLPAREAPGLFLPPGDPDHARFYPDVSRFLAGLFPASQASQVERAVRMVGVSPFTPLICLPLSVGERMVGSLSVWGTGLRKSDIPALSVFGSQVAGAIEKARLLDAVRRRVAEAETLREAATIVTSALDLEQVLDRILDQLFRVVPYDSAAVLLMDAECIQVVAGKGFANPAQVLGCRFPADDELIAETYRQGLPLALPDAQADPRFHNWAGDPAVHGWLVVPLQVRGVPLGALTLDSHRAGAYGEAEAGLAQAFANQAAIAIENARLFKQVRRLAITDGLTGVTNRRHFFEMAGHELERARRYGHPLSIIMWDIDHFKDVNDTYGHLAGDQVLQVVARRCRENLREIDLLGRYGGEEFVALLPEIGLPTARQVAERLRQAIADSPIICGEDYRVTITLSVGVADISGDCRHVEDLLARADQAMYTAKQAGRNRLAVWVE
ncbi:MAG TPA: diguanylate cyclase [Anaerolineales bacterium]